RLPKIAFPPDTVDVNTIDQFDLRAGRSPSEAEFNCSTASENRFSSGHCVAVNTIDQFDLLEQDAFSFSEAEFNCSTASGNRFPSDTVCGP
ncbi:hypothetical protein TNCV_372511, partial [Trichonephila clavipes]